MEVDDEILALYRRRASELRVNAAAMTEELPRQAMLDVAATYEKLIEQIRRLHAMRSKLD